MAKKKKNDPQIDFFTEAEITYQPITETVEKNYMPYVMSVIISRALPEIDGFKPSHRKLLYTMYTMGLLKGARTKSANVVGATMRLNPHGDAAIYETLVRLTRGNEALLHPFIDSKGSFGKQYSRDMAFAAARYTEVKLALFCEELFSGIDQNAVDFVPNYDNTTEEPVLFPTTFPNILISPNIGIAVGMACSIPSFNLAEVCDGTIALIKNPNMTVDRMMDFIKAPDFPGGAYIIYDRAKIRSVYETGVGSIKQRARYVYNKKDNCIDVLEIPYTSCIESIIKKITDLMKDGSLKGVTDVRDAIDLNGFRLTIDLKKGVDPDQLMARLFKVTDLEHAFDCNFNILINGAPRQMGIIEILKCWIDFRTKCLTRQLTFNLQKKKDKLHLLLGLGAIFLDIDKAIRIIRNTQKESEVITNLIEAFNLTQVQAEYIAEIRLRHLNREYILNRVSEIEELQKQIAELEEILRDDIKVKNLIAKQLAEIKAKYGQPRKTLFIDESEIVAPPEESMVEDYPVRVVLTHDGYFKKITMQSIKGNKEQKLKEGDEIVYIEDTSNVGELCVFTNKAQLYRTPLSQFDTMKAADLGDYLPAKLHMDDDEYPIGGKVILGYDPKHSFGFIYENGKAVKTPVTAYETKIKRKKLVQAFSSSIPCIAVFYEGDEPVDLFMVSDAGRAMLVSSSLVTSKVGRGAIGAEVFSPKKGEKLIYASSQFEEKYPAAGDYRRRKVPAPGIPLK